MVVCYSGSQCGHLSKIMFCYLCKLLPPTCAQNFLPSLDSDWLRFWILKERKKLCQYLSHTSQLQEKATKNHDPGLSKRFKSWSAAVVLPHPTSGAKINCYLCKLIKHLPPSSDQTFLASRDSDLLWVIISFHRWLFLLGSRALHVLFLVLYNE